MKKLFIIIMSGLLFFSCKKDYFTENGVHVGKFNMSTYDFLKSRPDVFDSVVMAIDLAGLKEFYQNEQVTFMAPHKKSIYSMMMTTNTYLKSPLKSDPRKKVRDSLNYTRDTVLMEDIDPATWKQLLLSYTLTSGRKVADFAMPNESHNSLSGEVTRTVIKKAAWQNVQDAGAKSLSYQFFRESKSIAGRTDTLDVRVVTTDLQTINGVVHALERQHEFGLTSGINVIKVRNNAN